MANKLQNLLHDLMKINVLEIILDNKKYSEIKFNFIFQFKKIHF